MGDGSSAPFAGATPTPVDAESLVLDATRAAVTQLAPEELEVFDSVATQWRDRVDRGGWSTPGGSVGFGIESALVTEVVIQVATAAIGEVFSLAAKGARSGWRRWRLRRKGGEPAAAVQALSEAEREDLLRQATKRHAAELGLSTARAALLADAIVGALRASGQQPAHGPATQEPVAQPVVAPVGDPVTHDDPARFLGDQP